MGHFTYKIGYFNFFKTLSIEFSEKIYETKIIVILDFPFQLPFQAKFYVCLSS